MRSLSGRRAWQAIAGGVVFHELFCERGQLLSEEVDRARAKHPVAVPAVIAVTALHLLRLIPQQVDPFYRVFLISEYLKEKQWLLQPIRSLAHQQRKTKRKHRQLQKYLLERLTNPWAP